MGSRGCLNYLLYRRSKLRRKYPLSRTDPFLTRFRSGFIVVMKPDARRRRAYVLQESANSTRLIGHSLPRRKLSRNWSIHSSPMKYKIFVSLLSVILAFQAI